MAGECWENKGIEEWQLKDMGFLLEVIEMF
jgi:hypothetical protein